MNTKEYQFNNYDITQYEEEERANEILKNGELDYQNINKLYKEC